MTKKLFAIMIAGAMCVAAPAWSAPDSKGAETSAAKKADNASSCNGYSSQLLKSACGNDQGASNGNGQGKGHCKGIGQGHDKGKGHGHDKDNDCPASS